jgi:hypothetical protein
MDWYEYLNSEDELPVVSGVRNMDQSPTKIQPKFHLSYSACFFLSGQQEVPSASQGNSAVWFLFILFHLIPMRVNSHKIKSPTKVQP